MRSGAVDGVEVAGDQPLGREVQHGIARFDVKDGVAVAVAADGHQVGHVPEQRPEQVASNRVRSCGSQSTRESVVSPPGVQASSKSRPPTVIFRFRSKVVVGSGNEKSIVAGSRSLRCS